MRTTRQPKTSSKTSPPAPTPPAANELLGLPGLGPTRIAALQAAGITSRAELAGSSVEQLIGVTGFQRASAEKLLTAVRDTTSKVTTPAPPTDELVPSPGEVGVSPEVPEPTDPEPESPGVDLDRASLTVTTMLSEATQKFPALEPPLTKFARRLQKLPAKTQKLAEKRRTKIGAVLDKFTAVLQKAIRRADDLSKAERKQLGAKIETAHDALRDATNKPKKSKSKDKSKGKK